MSDMTGRIMTVIAEEIGEAPIHAAFVMWIPGLPEARDSVRVHLHTPSADNLTEARHALLIALNKAGRDAAG